MKTPKDPEGGRPMWAPRARALARRLIRSHPNQPEQGPRIIQLPENLGENLIGIATNVWRIRAKLVHQSEEGAREDVSTEDLKKVLRYADSVIEALGRLGMEIKDRTGQTFDYGLPEKVVTIQPQPGLSREIIAETIRPTIYWDGQIAQQGEVVLGTPAASNPPEKEQ